MNLEVEEGGSTFRRCSEKSGLEQQRDRCPRRGMGPEKPLTDYGDPNLSLYKRKGVSLLNAFIHRTSK